MAIATVADAATAMATATLTMLALPKVAMVNMDDNAGMAERRQDFWPQRH